MLFAQAMLLLHCAVAMALSWGYLQRHPLTRPPIGVINGSDLILMLVGIVLMPYLYLLLPTWGVALVLGLGAWGILQMTVEPLVSNRWVGWLVTALLLLADGGSAWWFGVATAPHRLINNGLMLIIAVGISNLWTQSGIQARQVAILGAALTCYDFVFTTRLPLMADLFTQMTKLPFAPQLVWPLADGGISMGMGDLLFATLAVTIMAKAFGQVAAYLTFGLTLSAIGASMAILWLIPTLGLFPVMVLLGPLFVLHYWWWSRGQADRTLAVYRIANPVM